MDKDLVFVGSLIFLAIVLLFGGVFYYDMHKMELIAQAKDPVAFVTALKLSQ